jgi:hypothetical protein
MLAFVPFVPHVPQAPSPRAETLGQRLADTIHQFQQQNPGVSRLEVRQAMQLALARTAGDACPAPPRLVALVVGVLVAGLVLALALGDTRASSSVFVALAVVGLAAVVAVLAMLRNR